ncbi:methionine--tRNA ligase [Candidatus Woesearchaeota archaeon]|nr:methionine--tRNA ligase [Candidatus Woesearchaeota archaeon]
MTKKILITSALPYVNNIPHLGNLIGSTLSADVFARYMRLKHGKDHVLYVCGADEHGTATETKAKEDGVTPQELCDKYYAIHKDIYDWFNISFDVFGRTSKENHAKITRDLFKDVLTNGFIKEDTITQPFCTICNSFLADRFIEGTCPHCGYEEARGDQCDHCGKLLNPQDLQNPRCKSDGSTPEFRETKHLFLQLDQLQPELETWVHEQSKKGFWTQNAIRTTKAWFKEGLKQRAITRDLKWGISLPESVYDGQYKDKVFYVWFDAPIGYISLTEQLLGDAWQDWWIAGKADVDLYQFMGKDNIPFHSIIFPATLIAAGNKHNLVHHLDATEYLNYEHTKFSKSRGTGVFGNDAKETGIPADVFRYVLCYYRPENADTQFTWKGLQERLNNELVANFGNFVNRTLTFTQRFFEGKISSLDENAFDSDTSLRVLNWRAEIDTYLQLLDEVNIRDALAHFMKLCSMGNGFFQDAAPWKTKDDDPTKAKQDVAILINFVKDLAILAEPFMPETSEKIFKQLNWDVEGLVDAGELSVQNHVIGTPEILFQKIEDETVELLRAQFAGGKEEKQLKSDTQKITTATEPLKATAAKQKANMATEPRNVTAANKNPAKQLSVTDLDLRVGKIVHVIKHSNAEKLFIEKVDFGDGDPVQIVSGLVGHYTPKELEGKHIVVVRNLKPAKLRGELSHGMLLAAEDKEGTVALIEAPDAQLGDRVLPKDMNGASKEQIGIEEFFILVMELKNGKPYMNNQELLAEGKHLLADKGVLEGKIR